MMNLTDRYSQDIAGVLSCYDRVVLQGTVREWSYADAMAIYLRQNNTRIFDFAHWAEPYRDAIRGHAERIAEEHHLEIEFIRKIGAFRKEDRIAGILAERGAHPGLVHIFSAMEVCNTYRARYDKEANRTFLKPDKSKCLHYYFYFVDEEFGLCYLRVPTWAPFRLQFYFNGHSVLMGKLSKEGVGCQLQDNAFLAIDDFQKAQMLADDVDCEHLHRCLDVFAGRYCPIVAQLGLSYNWSIMQAEYATDILFKEQSVLQPLYEGLVRTAVHAVKPEDIATFLARKLHFNYEGEMGNRFNIRILGTRVKHQMGAVSIKMYDKFGIILRIEVTVNDVAQFKHYREVKHRDGTVTKQMAPVKKTIYSLYALQNICKACNRRYLEFVSGFDDPTAGAKKLNEVSKPVKRVGRSYKGFNFFSSADQDIFEALTRGGFAAVGFRNKHLRALLPHLNPAAVSRLIRRLREHGLVKRARNSYTYHLTKAGRAVAIAGLHLKATVAAPKIAEAIA